MAAPGAGAWMIVVSGSRHSGRQGSVIEPIICDLKLGRTSTCLNSAAVVSQSEALFKSGRCGFFFGHSEGAVLVFGFFVIVEGPIRERNMACRSGSSVEVIKLCEYFHSKVGRIVLKMFVKAEEEIFMSIYGDRGGWAGWVVGCFEGVAIDKVTTPGSWIHALIGSTLNCYSQAGVD